MNPIGIDLLNNFSEKEIIGLSAFVNCTHFNTDKYVVRLLEVLKREVLGKTFEGEMRLRVYEKVFSEKVPAKGWTEDQRKLMSAKLTGLTRLAERFLAIEALEENQVYRSDLVYQKLLEKRQYALFQRKMKQEEKILAAQAEKDLTHHSRCDVLEKSRLDYLHQTGKIYQKNNISEMLHHSNMRYFLQQLNLYVTVLSLEQISDNEFDKSSLDIALQLLDLPQYADAPMLQVYKATIHLMKTPNDVTCHILLDLLAQHAAHIPKSDLNGFYSTVTNFYIRQILIGQASYRDLFEVYRVMESHDLLVEEGFVPAGKLKNVIIAACRVSEFEWSKNILEKYKPLIRSSVRKSVCHFTVGVIAFYRKDYDTAIHHFIRVENVNNDYDLNSRTMIMKSHYENDKDFDNRTVQIFRINEKFFKENKYLPYKRKRGYKNFCQILINLYKFRHRSTKMTLESIKEKLEKQDVNSDRNWLLEKIKAL